MKSRLSIYIFFFVILCDLLCHKMSSTVKIESTKSLIAISYFYCMFEFSMTIFKTILQQLINETFFFVYAAFKVQEKRDSLIEKVNNK